MLSIVYITCNRASELKKSIMSCEEHVSIDHEYVIVDNGSTDDTESMVNNLIQEGVNIRYLKQKSNRGVSGGRNIGFSEAYGDICYFIDDDATIITDGFCLDDAYKYMRDNEKIYAMGTDCYDTEKKCQLVGIPEIGSDINSITKIRGYIGCSHFVRKRAGNSRFLYPDNLMYGSEELYSGMCCYKDGGVVVQFPRVKVLHCPSSNTRTSRNDRKRNAHINIYVIKKYLLPFPYNAVSSVMFLLRILRFEKINGKMIIEDIKTAKKRYDSQYNNKLSRLQIKKLCKLFGFKSII